MLHLFFLSLVLLCSTAAFETTDKDADVTNTRLAAVHDAVGQGAPTQELPIDCRVPHAVMTFQELQDTYDFGRTLGKGAQGFVVEASFKKNLTDFRLETNAPPVFGLKFQAENLTKWADHSSLICNQWAISGHPNVMSLYGVVIMNGYLVKIVPAYQGSDLESFLKKNPLPRSYDLMQTLVQGIEQGIAHIHSKNQAHRDLKPENIMVARLENGALRPVIIDLDMLVAGPKVMGTHRQGLPPGTFHYYSPQVASATLGWAVGLARLGYNFSLVQRKFPRDKEGMALVRKVQQNPPEFTAKEFSFISQDVFAVGLIVGEICTGELPIAMPSVKYSEKAEEYTWEALTNTRDLVENPKFQDLFTDAHEDFRARVEVYLQRDETARMISFAQLPFIGSETKNRLGFDPETNDLFRKVEETASKAHHELELAEYPHVVPMTFAEFSRTFQVSGVLARLASGIVLKAELRSGYTGKIGSLDSTFALKVRGVPETDIQKTLRASALRTRIPLLSGSDGGRICSVFATIVLPGGQVVEVVEALAGVSLVEFSGPLDNLRKNSVVAGQQDVADRLARELQDTVEHIRKQGLEAGHINIGDMLVVNAEDPPNAHLVVMNLGGLRLQGESDDSFLGAFLRGLDLRGPLESAKSVFLRGARKGRSLCQSFFC